MTNSEAAFKDVAKVGGLPLRRQRPDEAAARVCASAIDNYGELGQDVHLVNAYTIALTNSDDEYAELLANASMNFPDGRPLTWIPVSGGGKLHQVRGPQLFLDCMDVGRRLGVRHYLLGGSDQTLSALQQSLHARFPGVEIVGAASPPFRPLTTAEITLQDKKIRESGAHIVWVGLGTPKQDYECARIGASLPVTAVAVGAAFDFVAGSKREAPRWMSKVGIEWMFRLASEPRRLWRRYLIGNAVFLWVVLIKQKLRA